jgi:hypothetical protein
MNSNETNIRYVIFSKNKKVFTMLRFVIVLFLFLFSSKVFSQEILKYRAIQLALITSDDWGDREEAGNVLITIDYSKNRIKIYSLKPFTFD